MKYTFILWSFLIAGPSFGATDYSSCSEVFNRYGWVYTYYPFEPTKDGKIKPVSGVNNYKFDKQTNTHSVEEKIEDLDKYSKKKVFRIIVHELKVDQNGNWVSYESINKNAEKEVDRKLEDKRSNITGVENTNNTIIYSRKIDFKVLNGTCIPFEESNSSIRISNRLGKDNQIISKKSLLETRIFNTELCHDIFKFLRENPNAQSCFDVKLNSAIGEIFKKYMGEDKNNGIGYPGSKGNGFGVGIGILGIQGFPIQNLDAQLNLESDASTGKTPIIAAHSILDSCQSNPLTKSAFDDKLWETESSIPVKSSSANAVSR